MITRSSFSGRSLGLAALFGAVLLCVLVDSMLLSGPDPEPARQGATLPSSGTTVAPANATKAESSTVDPAAQAELERLSRATHAELVAAARAPTGFSRLLAMNILWARGERAVVEQIAVTSGDRTLLAKAQALASREAKR